MAKNGNGCKTFEISGGCNFRKGNTYVFAALIIRDREVGGSNPLAPTNQLIFNQLLTDVGVNGRFSSCGQFVDKIF